MKAEEGELIKVIGENESQWRRMKANRGKQR